ncbi:LytR/AlgR family response regulator transcription factor [Granulicella arctica]|uniref:Two-component system LytT family response regulator n=1 Tax=Granulicella arctica TaxID=940613 RepID=A0A7Y9PDJ1_9BACT|nr:response regulator [Granulicella arctica]NYF77941.1 two-component system LytT family response regulator [Granulicella arctica]
MKIRVLVVDDEPLARQGVALRLQHHRDIEIIGECVNGREAQEFILKQKPDLVFLDIQMPYLNGIDLLRSLPLEAHPFVIFLTAFDEYVLRAFEVHAIDYLLKPVDDARFSAALQHARRVLDNQGAAEYRERMQKLLRTDQEETTQPQLRELSVRIGKQVRFVNVDEIDWIEAQGDYAEIHVGTRTHLIRESLSVLSSRLDAAAFIRIHRGAIVRVNRIASISSLPNRDCCVTLQNGTALRVSRTYSDHLRKLLRNKAALRMNSLSADRTASR